LSIDLFSDLLIHTIADIMGKGIAENAAAFMNFADQICAAYADAFVPIAKHPRLLNGDDLIGEFGLSPSPLFTKILSHVEEERLSGNIRTREDALAVVKNFLNIDNLS